MPPGSAPRSTGRRSAGPIGRSTSRSPRPRWRPAPRSSRRISRRRSARPCSAKGRRCCRRRWCAAPGSTATCRRPCGASLAQELRDAHCGEVSEPVVEGMFRVQRARDAMMADRLATVAGRAGGVLIAGNGHVRNDRGVPWYLARLRPTARIVERRPGRGRRTRSRPSRPICRSTTSGSRLGSTTTIPAPTSGQRGPRARPCSAAAVSASRAGASPRAGARAGSARCSRSAARGP